MVWIPKPVLELKMEGNADDSSGYDNHGVVTDATLTDDRWGHPNSAYSFNGTSAFIDCGNQESLQTGKNWTMEYVITRNVDSGVREYISTTANQYNYGYLCYIHTDDTFALHFQESSGSWRQIIVYSSSTIPIGMETHAIVTFDETYIKIYINGILETISIDLSGYLNAAYLKTQIGRARDVGTNNYGYNFNSCIDFACKYPVALTPTQVKYLYNKSKRNYGGLP